MPHIERSFCNAYTITHSLDIHIDEETEETVVFMVDETKGMWLWIRPGGSDTYNIVENIRTPLVSLLYEVGQVNVPM